MLINCVLYQEGKKIRDIPMDENARWSGAGEDGFVWVALKDPTPAELERVQRQFGLHELAVEDALQGHQRPKIEEYGESLFFVIHLIEMVEGELHIGEVDVFLGPHYVVSVRSRSEQGFLGVRSRAEREPHMLRQGSTFVAYALLDAVIDRYFPVLDSLESELERIEAQIFERGSGRSNIERLYKLKQQVGELRHAVAPLMEALGRLLGGRAPSLCLPSQHYFRNAYDHLSRINAATESIRDTIGTAIQVNLSMVTIEEGEVTKRLAAWAAIFAVIPALAGIWGMNFKYMPDLEWVYGYPLAIGLMVSVCGVLYSRFRAARWI